MTTAQTPVGEASGLKLIRLIETRIQEILLKERNNTRKICLYNTGEYWTAFEHSAYQLHLLFPDSKTFVINHPNFTDSVVGLSVSGEQVRTFIRTQVQTIAQHHSLYVQHNDASNRLNAQPEQSNDLSEQQRAIYTLTRNELNYKEIITSVLSTEQYYAWHQLQEEKFSEVDGYVCKD